jgi:hypothetical protein
LILFAAVAAKLPSISFPSSCTVLNSFAYSNSLQSMLQLPVAELHSEVSSSASTLAAVLSLCEDLISRCKNCGELRVHETELRNLAAEVTKLLDESAAASATLDSAIDCQTRVCNVASSKFLQLEFRLRSLESKS